MIRLAVLFTTLILIALYLVLQYMIIGLIFCAAIAILFFVFLFERTRQAEQTFYSQFHNDKILISDKRAIIRAQKSCGYSQAQGMGYLVLTDKGLYFNMQLLDRSIGIDNSAIVDVDKSNRLLGVGTIKPMLIIEYRTNKETIDTIALHVDDVDLWIHMIDKIIIKRKERRSA